MKNDSYTLWEEMKSGDMKAYHQIYEAHVAFLYNYGKKLSGQQALVEDCIHDLFVDLWTRRERLGTTDAIRPYLVTSLRRVLVKQMKKDQKIQSVDDHQELAVSQESSIEDWIIKNDMIKENSDRLKNAYTVLTNRQREIIYLRFHQNMDYEDIAEVLGVKYQSLRNLLSNAIGGMRAAMVSTTLLMLLSFASCTETEEPAEVDGQLRPYFELFKEEALLRGAEITLDFEAIGAELTSISDASAQCVTQGDGERTIRVDQGYWDRIGTSQKEFLIFHELGHCYLGLGHDDAVAANGICTSMMMSGLGDCRGNYNNDTREEYINGLFGL